MSSILLYPRFIIRDLNLWLGCILWARSNLSSLAAIWRPSLSKSVSIMISNIPVSLETPSPACTLCATFAPWILDLCDLCESLNPATFSAMAIKGLPLMGSIFVIPRVFKALTSFFPSTITRKSFNSPRSSRTSSGSLWFMSEIFLQGFKNPGEEALPLNLLFRNPSIHLQVCEPCLG